ncbi:VOC family protein [Streptomyces iconiensis]|uniref:VOC family protein n=1 Tax=Streptomyces iconiensis TaxID=1384038 RepID=A0ABT6ZVD5_9ACTN|nr:VOC family protein [Streptomyces iconiensis]MDJ1133037.1 VOC family protein [Streptomyces iconiensis]
MPEPTSYRPGALCWTELHAPDAGAAERFYAAVLGWGYVYTGPEFDHYRYATSRRQMVAGIAPTEEAKGSWIVFFAAREVDVLAERVKAAGGEVDHGPADVGVLGRNLLAVDPCGAHVGFWQPRAHLGAGLFDEPSALCWAELAVRDTAEADRFYADVLGLRVAAHAAAGDARYAAFRLADGEAVAGRTVLGPERKDAEPFWMPYFGVTDARRATDVSVDYGATVLYSGVNAEGRGVAVVSDPWEAVFAVLEVPSGH